MPKHFYGCKRDIADPRDKVLSIPKLGIERLPAVVSMRSKCPPIFDQGDTNSCTGQATAAGLKLAECINATVKMPSRLFIYYNGRLPDNGVSSDGGAFIRNVIKGIKKYGFADESIWPFDAGRITVKPDKSAYNAGDDFQLVEYARVPQTLYDIRRTLAHGYPVICGIAIYSSFESERVSKTGVVPMPLLRSEELIGWHAVLVIGYNDDKRMFECRNSWSSAWGDSGYFWLPYEFLTNYSLAADLWVISKIKWQYDGD